MQGDGRCPQAVVDLYRREAELADGDHLPDTAADPAWWPVELFGDMPQLALRGTVLHVITETACHAGHLDAVRELIDGRTWLVLTD